MKSHKPAVWPTFLCGFCILVMAALIYPGFSVSRMNEEPLLFVEIDSDMDEPWLAAAGTLTAAVDKDLILDVFRDSETSDMVVEFFSDITGSQEIAYTILINAEIHNVPAALAFSLCYEESRYNPRAINGNNRNRTVDRGLFQLNSASFPDLTEDEFFNSAINSWYGLSYLRWCLDTAGTEVAGLAMYNAGVNRVRESGTPKVTLDYVSRIMNRQRTYDERFLTEYTKPYDDDEEIHVPQIIPLQSPVFSLSLLFPLGRY